MQRNRPIGQSVDILLREYQQIDCTDRGKRKSDRDPAPRGQQKRNSEHQVGQKFGADAPARRIPGDGVVKAEGMQKQEIRDERIRRVVRIAGDFDIGPHATGGEFDESRPQNEHKKREMQRPESAEPPYYESKQIPPCGKLSGVGVCNHKAAQYKKEIDK